MIASATSAPAARGPVGFAPPRAAAFSQAAVSPRSIASLRSAALACAVALAGGCAAWASPRSPMPLPEPAPGMDAAGAAPPSAEQAARAQRHRACLSRMYTQRQYRGRGAPHWPIYDLCMKEQGASR